MGLAGKPESGTFQNFATRCYANYPKGDPEAMRFFALQRDLFVRDGTGYINLDSFTPALNALPKNRPAFLISFYRVF